MPYQDMPYHEILPMLPSLEDYIHIALSYKLLSSSIDHRSATKINVHTHCLWNTVLNNLDGRQEGRLQTDSMGDIKEWTGTENYGDIKTSAEGSNNEETSCHCQS